MTTTEEDAALAEFEAAVGRMKADQQWQETMRQCETCRAWVNRHIKLDELVRVCPNFNLCEGN